MVTYMYRVKQCILHLTHNQLVRACMSNCLTIYRSYHVQDLPLFNIAFPASEEIINNSDLVSLQHQSVNQVASHKTCSTCYLQSE